VIRYIKANSLQDVVLKEEERLFYVALSRAEEYLFIVTEEKHQSSFVKTIIRNQPNHEIIYLRQTQLVKAAE